MCRVVILNLLITVLDSWLSAQPWRRPCFAASQRCMVLVFCFSTVSPPVFASDRILSFHHLSPLLFFLLFSFFLFFSTLLSWSETLAGCCHLFFTAGPHPGSDPPYSGSRRLPVCISGSGVPCLSFSHRDVISIPQCGDRHKTDQHSV